MMNNNVSNTQFEIMYFFNHILSSNKDSDVELHELESGKRSGGDIAGIYPHLPMPFNSQMGVGGSPVNISTNFDTASMQIETSGGMQLSPAEVEMQSGPDPKRSRSQSSDQVDPNKVRIVPQTSRIPTLVSAFTRHMK
jgi:hypothetical protein